MSRTRALVWPGVIAGFVLWAGCNAILGTDGEPHLTAGAGASGGDTGAAAAGPGGTGGDSTTSASGGSGGAGGCTEDEDATWSLPLSDVKRFTGGEEIIKDNATKLSWLVMPSPAPVPFGQAADACQEGLRLPTRIELLSIVNYSIVVASTLKVYTGFKGDGELYWTGTVDLEGKPWAVNFKQGEAAPQTTSLNAFVRCVKNGP
jgi:hypothetical protein